MQKQGFKGQWIAISKQGKFNDSAGNERDLNESFLKEVVANFSPSDAPAVIGHPADNAPAWGWVSALRLNNDVLEAQFADTDDEFEQMVETGKFKKRSASFYLNPPSLRHVGFLGAMPPAVKGLQDIKFSDGESVTVEISFKEQTMSNENLNTLEEKKTFSEWMKEFFGGKNPAQPVNFSEADQQSLIDRAVAKATEEAKKAAMADFNEELKKRDDQILVLTQSVNATSVSGRRAEIVAFCEAIPAEKGKHFLKRAGIVEFMESLAEADAKDEKEAISFSEGEGGAKVEHKFSRLDWFKNYVNAQGAFVEFGEKFGNLVATKDADVVVDGGNLDTLRDGMGMKKADGGGK